MKLNSSELKKRISIQCLNKKTEGHDIFYLDNEKRIYSKVEEKYQKVNFSKLGFGANMKTKFIIRKNNKVNLNNSIVYNNRHYIVISVGVLKDNENYSEVITTQLTPKECIVIRNIEGMDKFNRPIKEKRTVCSFPGYLTEKYLGYTSNSPISETNETFILVANKVIDIKVGDLIKIDGVTYNVILAHTIEEHRNEFEITVKKEV